MRREGRLDCTEPRWRCVPFVPDLPAEPTEACSLQFTVSNTMFLKMFICLKRFLRKIVEQRNLYTYLHRPVLERSAEDLKAQFKWGRAKAQVSYEEDALAFDVQLSKSPRLLLL